MVTNINFSVSHAQRANVNEVNKERDEKIASFFKNIERRLIERKPRMKSIHQALQQLSSIGGYAHDEEEIMHSLRTCQRYQNDPRDNYLQKKFFDQASTLPKHLENLLDGLLGQRLLNADIMAILSDANQVNKLKGGIMLELVLSGCCFSVATENYKNKWRHFFSSSRRDSVCTKSIRRCATPPHLPGKLNALKIGKYTFE